MLTTMATMTIVLSRAHTFGRGFASHERVELVELGARDGHLVDSGVGQRPHDLRRQYHGALHIYIEQS